MSGRWLPVNCRKQLSAVLIEREADTRLPLVIEAVTYVIKVGTCDVVDVVRDEDFRDFAAGLVLFAHSNVAVAVDCPFLSGFHGHPPGRQSAFLVIESCLHRIGQGLSDEILVVAFVGEDAEFQDAVTCQ